MPSNTQDLRGLVKVIKIKISEISPLSHGGFNFLTFRGNRRELDQSI